MVYNNKRGIKKMRGKKMKKKELVDMHKILSVIKKRLEKDGIANNGSFKKYNELNIGPQKISRSKEEHKKAIKTLSEELALALCIK